MKNTMKIVAVCAALAAVAAIAGGIYLFLDSHKSIIRKLITVKFRKLTLTMR